MKQRRSVLALVYSFPPMAGSGAIRNLKLLMRLAELGWSLRVLTVRTDGLTEGDELCRNLLEQIPQETEVLRTRCFDTKRFFGNLKQALLKSTSIRRQEEESHTDETTSAEASSTACKPGVGKLRGRSRSQRLKDFITDVFSIPDRYVGWLPFAVCGATSALRKQKADVIYAIGKPWTAFFVGYALKLIFRIPLVIDFMDPWRASTWAPAKGRFLDKLQAFLEWFIVHRADFVIANTDELAEDFARRLKLPPARIGVITCGFDENDFHSFADDGARKNGRFTITHTGSFYKRRTPVNFLKAVKTLLDKRLIAQDDITINFVGRMSIRDPELFRLLGDEALSRVLHRESWVPHAKAIEYLHLSDLLLVIQPDTRLQIPAKLYEYACTRKPILALAEKDGALDNIMRRESWGYSVENRDIHQIAEAVYRLYRECKDGTGCTEISRASIQPYSVRSLAEKLSGILEEVATARRSR